MGQTDRDQKTEAPTAKRKRDAARDGDVLQSRDMAAALVVGGGLACVAIAGPDLVAVMRNALIVGLRFQRDDIVGFDPLQAAREVVEVAAVPVGLFGAATLLAAFAAPALLGSFGFRINAVTPKWSRLDPLAGLKRSFGTQAAIEFGKALLKLLAFGAIAAFSVSFAFESAAAMSATSHSAAIAMFGTMMLALVAALVGGLALLGLGDAFVQHRLRFTRLRMSRQDVRDEMKESDGSPETRHFARQRRQELLANSMRRSVSEATVILNNPSHFSVALRYRPGQDMAPVLVARGRDEAALAIRTVATEARVPQLDYPELARAIYFTSRAGQIVKDDLFVAVATVLAFVFRLDPEASAPLVTVPGSRRFDENGKRA